MSEASTPPPPLGADPGKLRTLSREAARVLPACGWDRHALSSPRLCLSASAGTVVESDRATTRWTSIRRSSKGSWGRTGSSNSATTTSTSHSRITTSGSGGTRARTTRRRSTCRRRLVTTAPLILRGSPSRSRSVAGSSTSAARVSISSARSWGVWVGSPVRRAWHTLPARPARDRPRIVGRCCLGWDRGLPEGDRGRTRSDHDDHAQLGRVLGRQATFSAATYRCRTTPTKSIPISDDVVSGARLSCNLGNPQLQALHRRQLPRAGRR